MLRISDTWTIREIIKKTHPNLGRDKTQGFLVMHKTKVLKHSTEVQYTDIRRDDTVVIQAKGKGGSPSQRNQNPDAEPFLPREAWDLLSEYETLTGQEDARAPDAMGIE